MTSPSTVALLSCETYDHCKLKKIMDLQLRHVLTSTLRGRTVLLKPNLVSGRGHDGLGCTSANFITAAAELFLDHGARLRIGDSPAFGSAKDVMFRFGITSALKKSAVELIDFTEGPAVKLAHGVTVRLAKEVFDCDLLLNMPRVKAHCQLRVSLAVKNMFGTVFGWRKPLLHMRYDDRHNNFVKLLVDLLDLFPAVLHLMDGVIAMHGTGPVSGSPFPLGVVGLSQNAVALDTALMTILDLPFEKSPIWLECKRRDLHGVSLQQIIFPFQDANQLRKRDFHVPEQLSPIRFHPLHAVGSVCRRLFKR